MAENLPPTIELDAKDFEELESPEVEAETTESESSTDENKTDKPAEAEKDVKKTTTDEADESETEGEEDESEAEADEEEESAEETEVEQPKKGAEARKTELQNEIRGLVSHRNELRQEIVTLNAQHYKPQTAAELQEEGLSPEMAEIQALKQANQMSDYNAHVTDLNANLNIESLQVMSDYPVFDPESPEYDEALATRAKSIYEKAAGIKKDAKTGLIIQANVLPYDIYKAFAETASSGAKKGEVSGQKAAEKNLASAETLTPSVAPKKAKEDPFLSGLTKGLELEKA